MGHRANFVIVRDGKATTYFDNWAGLGAALMIADGPIAAEREAAQFEEVDEMLDWAFAEGGCLLDFDERRALVFGELEDVLAEFCGDEADEESIDDTPADARACAADAYRAYFSEIAAHWQGWCLRYDDRGVDAFAEHLKRRGIERPKAAPASHPDDVEALDMQF